MALKHTQFICFLISSLTREEVGKKYTRWGTHAVGYRTGPHETAKTHFWKIDGFRV
jgi:hypothetical protein